MSYCRWSTDSFRCDLYCYESADGGWVTHVAGNRIPDNAPREDWSLIQTNPDEFWRQHESLMVYLEDCERSPIGLPHDGESFRDGSLNEFRERLLTLRQIGYRFPDDVISEVDEEISEQASA